LLDDVAVGLIGDVKLGASFGSDRVLIEDDLERDQGLLGEDCLTYCRRAFEQELPVGSNKGSKMVWERR
jgi:hypothetical protein